jgi:hypothetical protein
MDIKIWRTPENKRSQIRQQNISATRVFAHFVSMSISKKTEPYVLERHPDFGRSGTGAMVV